MPQNSYILGQKKLCHFYSKSGKCKAFLIIYFAVVYRNEQPFYIEATDLREGVRFNSSFIYNSFVNSTMKALLKLHLPKLFSMCQIAVTCNSSSLVLYFFLSLLTGIDYNEVISYNNNVLFI